eukprot:TRINITY_DN19037_c0_g1_i1.p1 TRINITY_DN19037_c0_g1~~TRINITY_DN19037_c0_g1_i1.p1  ORF type:complete len:386 (-),score=67.88 TRINITY_DN19037_c0_g1_i1:135-1292(-)
MFDHFFSQLCCPARGTKAAGNNPNPQYRCGQPVPLFPPPPDAAASSVPAPLDGAGVLLVPATDGEQCANSESETAATAGSLATVEFEASGSSGSRARGVSEWWHGDAAVEPPAPPRDDGDGVEDYSVLHSGSCFSATLSDWFFGGGRRPSNSSPNTSHFVLCSADSDEADSPRPSRSSRNVPAASDAGSVPVISAVGSTATDASSESWPMSRTSGASAGASRAAALSVHGALADGAPSRSPRRGSVAAWRSRDRIPSDGSSTSATSESTAHLLEGDVEGLRQPQMPLRMKSEPAAAAAAAAAEQARKRDLQAASRTFSAAFAAGAGLAVGSQASRAAAQKAALAEGCFDSPRRRAVNLRVRFAEEQPEARAVLVNGDIRVRAGST